MRVEDEARPTHVDAILKRAARVRVNRNPFLVVERRWRGSLVDERRRTPAQGAPSVKRPLVDCYGVRRARAIEPQTRIVNVALAVEREE